METRNLNVRIAGLTIGFFVLAFFSKAILSLIPGYDTFLESLPYPIQRLEQPLRWMAICLIGLYAAHRAGFNKALREVGLTAPAGRAILFSFIACSPMLVVPMIVGSLNPELSLLRGVLFGAVIYPMAEEILFRGYAFRQLHRRANFGLWTAAVLVGLAFGVAHLGQAAVRQMPLSGEIGTVAIISIGGILYAWLFAKWDDNLWVPFGMHMFMNLWWDVFSLAENPLGGWLPNVLRLLTVVLAIVLTLYRDRIPILARTPHADTLTDPE